MEAKFRCVGYARISQRNKHARGADTDITKSEQSIEHQKNYIRTFCESHPDYELIDIFQDTKSGTLAANRDGFQKALNYLNNGVAGCNALIVYQKDRLGRNAMEYIKLLWDTQTQNKYIFELSSTSAEPICLTHNLDKQEKPNILTIVQDAMDAFAIESYLMGLSEKAIQFNKDKVLNKHKFYTGGNPKFGYRIIKEPEPHYEIVEDEAEAIRLVYRLYVDNKWGARKIVNYLNSHSYTFRSTKKTLESKRHIFTYDNVQKILNCPEYATGEKVIWKRTSIVLRKQLQRDLLQAFPDRKSVNFISDEELDEFLKTYNGGTTRYNYVIKDVYPVIIDKETYEKYLNIKKNRGPAIKEPLDPNETGWLSGIIYCECGQKMFCHGKRMATYIRKNKTCPPVEYQTYNYYQCRSYIKGTITKPYGAARCNAKKATVTYAIDEFVYATVCEIIKGTTVHERIAEAIKEKKMMPLSPNSKESRLSNLQDIISSCNKKLSVIAERKAVGYYDNQEGYGPTKQDYQNDVNKVISERDEAYAAIDRLKIETSRLDYQLSDYNNIVEEWNRFKEDDKSGFLHAFLSRVDVFNQDNGDVCLDLYLKVYEGAKIDGQDINPIHIRIPKDQLRKKPRPYKRYNKWVALKNKKESS